MFFYLKFRKHFIFLGINDCSFQCSSTATVQFLKTGVKVIQCSIQCTRHMALNLFSHIRPSRRSVVKQFKTFNVLLKSTLDTLNTPYSPYFAQKDFFRFPDLREPVNEQWLSNLNNQSHITKVVDVIPKADISRSFQELYIGFQNCIYNDRL